MPMGAFVFHKHVFEILPFSGSILLLWVQDKSVRHTNIVIESNGYQKKYFLVKEKKFDSVEELMLFYRTNEIKNLQNVKNVRFLYAVESGRGSRSHDNGSASSESSYDRYTSPGSSAGMVDPSNIPQNRPPLPARPKDLPRRNSSHSSMGSPGAVFTLSPSASGTSMEEGLSQQHLRWVWVRIPPLVLQEAKPPGQ
ncbi:hypothetical protein FSP39_000789 [Pinctada imbricata]|uniref:SH2 domain-containing protein n=1 Tax=Pinctada imbricata TaxID=66713 RepID=A0AA88Y970_PINIB|nr:hypothetical protein FSP39_000789 [Pinctada imbricata]